MDHSGAFAQILFPQNYGNPKILKAMTLRWSQSVVGIPYLQVNVQNVALHSQECVYLQSSGYVNVVDGKMICLKTKKLWHTRSVCHSFLVLFTYSLRSLQMSRPLTLAIVCSTAAEAAIISRSSPPRYKRPKLPTATISKILIEAAFSASLAARAA